MCSLNFHRGHCADSQTYIFFDLSCKAIGPRIYVKQKYQIDWKIKYTEEPIKQKWNGVAQHVAAFILDGTDTLVLSIFSTLSNVSVYSVYLMIINGVKGIFLSMTSGIRALLGEFWAKQEIGTIK